MFSKFIHRPVLAIVTSLVILFVGMLAIKTLPTSQFPEVAPRLVMVSASYPGASAKSLAESVIIPLETVDQWRVGNALHDLRCYQRGEAIFK